MKAFKFLLVSILLTTLFFACDKDSDGELLDSETHQIQKNALETRGTHSIPFKANFYTKRDTSNHGIGFCNEAPFLGFNHQVGGGIGTHLGKFTTTMSFCGGGLDYKNGQGVFVAANGDELYFYAPSPDSIGHVIPFLDDFYEAYFQDPFTFNGGTGRFEGASGGGYTDSYVDLYDEDGFIDEHQTDHEWTGTLILP